MEPNDNFDDFDTQIQSDELIPDGYEDRDDELEPWDDNDHELEGLDEAFAAEDAPDLDNDAYGDDRDGYDGGDDFPW